MARTVRKRRRPPCLFLSHSGADSAAAAQLRDRILASPAAKKAGLTVWFDRAGAIKPGNAGWMEQIEAAIETESTAFAVYVGSKGVINWVDRETDLGLSRATTDKAYPFIPILSPDAKGVGALSPFARQHQAVLDPLGNDAELARLLEAVLGGAGTGAEPPVLTEDPFVGLRAMTEKDADRFFGRKAEVDELLERMRRFRLVAISAESGSGKSSLAQAGIIPKFRGGALEDADRLPLDDRVLHVVVMRPLADPAEGLRQGITRAAEQLGRSGAEQDNLRSRVNPGDPAATAYAIRCDLPIEATETLLVVDQFEELRTAPPETQRAFVSLLAALAAMEGDNGFRVLITVREDYFDLFLGPELLGPSFSGDNAAARYNLERISDAGLADAISRPLVMAGHDNPGERDALVAAFQQDTRQRPGDLSLVQMALFVIWQRRDDFGGDLLQTYVGVGGVSGALATAAEGGRVRLSAAEQALLFPIFVRLIRLGATGGVTRRTANVAEFSDAARALIDRLSGAEFGRLLIRDGDTVDLAHEALITRWVWLNNQLNAENVPRDARRLERLTEAGETWEKSPPAEKPGHLPSRADLDAFAELGRDRPDWLSSTEHSFIAAGEAARRAAASARRLQFAGLAAASVALLAVGVAALFFWQASGEIQRRSETVQLALDANLAASALDDGDRLDAMQLAANVVAKSATRDDTGSVKAQAIGTLYAAMINPMPWATLPARSIGVDGARVRLSSVEGTRTTVSEYDPATGILTVLAERDEVFTACTWAVCYNDNGTLELETGSWATRPEDFSVLAASPRSADLVFAVADSQQDLNERRIQSLDVAVAAFGEVPNLLGHFTTDPEWQPVGAYWSGSGERFAIVGQDNSTVFARGTMTGVALAAVVDGGYSPLFAVFSPDGRWVATTTRDFPLVRIWDVATGGSIAELQSGGREGKDVAFSPDGSRVVTGTQDGLVRIFSLPDGALVAELERGRRFVVDLDYDLLGERICALWADGRAMVWDARTLAVVDGPIVMREETAQQLSCQHGYLYLSSDEVTEVWSIAGIESPALTATVVPDAGRPYQIAFDAATGRAAIEFAGEFAGCDRRWLVGTGPVPCVEGENDYSPQSYQSYDWELYDPQYLYYEGEIIDRVTELCLPHDDQNETCVPKLAPDEKVLRVQAGRGGPAVGVLATNMDRMILFDEPGGRPPISFAFPENTPLEAVTYVRLDWAAGKLFLFIGVDYIQVWDIGSGAQLADIATTYTYFGMPTMTMAVDDVSKTIAVYRGDTIYEYRYFADLPEMIAAARQRIDQAATPVVPQ